MIAVDHFFRLDDSFVDHASAILVARNPSWLPEFVDALLDGEGTLNWRVARALVGANAVPAPDHPQYFRGAVRGVPDYLAKDRQPLIDQLDADPDLVGEAPTPDARDRRHRPATGLPRQVPGKHLRVPAQP